MFLFGVAYPAPIDLPTSVKGLQGKLWSWEEGDELTENIELSLAGEFDFVNERELEELDAEVEGNIYAGKAILTFADRIDLYGTFGEARDIKYKAKILGTDVKFDLDNEFVWGVGLNMLLYDWKDYGIKLFVDGKYREIQEMDYKSVTVNGITYSKAQIGGKINAEWKEWQVALGVSKQFKFLIPYMGVKYSDVDASAKATIGGATYDLGSTGGDKVVGVFIGCSIVPAEQFSIDLEGRFIDEKAFTVRATYKF